MAVRRHPGQQRRLARHARVHPLPARRRADFTINRMLTFDSVRLRLDREQPLTFLEFNYMILQAYDFLELSRRVGCRLQFGGSDQWGNIVNGIELDAADRRDRALRRHDAADHHGRRGEDGQDRARARCGSMRAAVAVRLLAILAEHGRCRRRALPQAVHRFAARRHRPAGEPVGAEINQAKIVLATEATACSMGARRRAAEQTARGDVRGRRRGRGFAHLCSARA